MVRAPPDALRDGWHKACEDVQPMHPVEQQAQQVRSKSIECIPMSVVMNKIHGSHENTDGKLK